MNKYAATFLTLLSLASSAVAGPNDKKVCPSATPQMWERQQKDCVKAFAKGLERKQIELTTVNNLCGCVSDGLVVRASCPDIKRFDTDKKFQQEYTAKISKDCLAKYGPKRK